MFSISKSKREENHRARLDASSLYDTSNYEVDEDSKEDDSDEREIKLYVDSGDDLQCFCAPCTDANLRRLRTAIADPENHKWIELDDYDNELEFIRTDRLVIFFTE